MADFNTPSGAAFDAEDVSPQIEDMKLDPPEPPEPPAERNLMSGWVSTRRNSNSPSAKPQKLWLVVTDTRMLLQTEAGGETLERIDSDRLLSVGVAPSSSGGATPGRDAAHKERRFQLLVRLRAPPASSPPPLTTRSRSSFESSTTALLALLSPMIGNRRRQSWQHHTQAARSGAPGGGGGSGSGGGAAVEMLLLVPSSWEAEAWSEAIAESGGALVRAASLQRWGCVDRLLALGRHVTSAEPNGRTALHYAAGYGDGGAIRVLLEANADVNQMDVAGITPVACAALKQQHGVIAVLLAAGADPTLAARQGVWAGRSAVDMARDVGCDRSASALLRHCWCSLLPFEVKMLVFAYLGPSDLGAAALTCSDWCSLVLTGRQLGALPDTPPRSPAWLAHAAALGAKAPAQPPLSPRERSGSVNGRPAAAATLGGRSPGSPRAGSPAPPVPPPPSSPAGGSSGRKRPCLVLDLDETLVHASAVPVPGCDFSFTFSFAGGVHTMYVRRRPFLDFFFNHLLVSGAWEVVIFTASVQAYADAMLDLLDPKGELFARRLYREHCCPVDASYAKDLAVIGRDIATTVLVDNTPLSFAYQPANGIPISTWRHDDSDRELLALLPLLDELAAAGDDLRPLLARRCRVQQIMERWSPHIMFPSLLAPPLLVAPAAAANGGGATPLSPRRRSPQVEADIAAARARSADGGGGDANAAAEAPLSPPAAPAPPPPFVPPVNLSPVHQAA